MPQADPEFPRVCEHLVDEAYEKKNKLNENKSGQQTETETDINFSPIKSFAVVWDWTEGNSIEDVIPIIQKQVAEVNDLWKKGIIENAYIDTKSQLNDTETFSNAFFIINGKSEKEVRTILNKTPAFTSGITKYKLYPVGVKWLKRNSKAMQKAQESKNSFAVVWTPIEYDEKYEQMVEEQGMKIIIKCKDLPSNSTNVYILAHYYILLLFVCFFILFDC